MSRIPNCVWTSVLALASFAPARAGELAPKQVAAPPSDVLAGLLRLPEPAELATRSRVLARELAFAPAGGGWIAEVPLEVDVAGELVVAWASPDPRGWRVRIVASSGAAVDLDAAASFGASERDGEVLADALPGWVAERRHFAAAPRGEWLLRFESDGAAREAPRGLCVVRTAGGGEIASWVATHATLAGEPIAVLAELGDAGSRRASATGSVRFEWAGTSLAVALADDGAHEDGAAGDGLFGAFVPAAAAGEVRAWVELAARDPAGGVTRRSALLALDVLERRVLLDGGVAASVADPLRLRLELGAYPLGPSARLQVSAEVWGSDAQGEPVPVCWLARMVEPLPSPDGERWRLSLYLDARWLELAGALPPFELRRVRVQDPDTHVVLDEHEALALEIGELPRAFGAAAGSVVPSMLTGPIVAPLANANQAGITPHPPNPALMLVHGYCSGGSVWPAADFTAPKVEFLDPNQNRTHDQFAQLIGQTGAPYASFGVVAHSQGGCAALHLLTYYQSGLDYAVGPRRIQSVATPYQGTPLASWGGFACGVNADMEPANSVVWLAGIPSWARANVYYWTTSNSGSACNFFTNFLLTDPEDGTVEQVRGQLPGASSMGHVVGWCHTTGMSNPANYTDHARNQQMNALAAR